MRVDAMKSLSEFLSPQRSSVPTIADFPREVGQRLRRARLAFEWRQIDVAKKAGVSVQTVKSMEKGKSVSYESLLRLLRALGFGADFLQMLDSPNFPNLRAHEHFLALKTSPTRALRGNRVRKKIKEQA